MNTLRFSLSFPPRNGGVGRGNVFTALYTWGACYRWPAGPPAKPRRATYQPGLCGGRCPTSHDGTLQDAARATRQISLNAHSAQSRGRKSVTGKMPPAPTRFLRASGKLVGNAAVRCYIITSTIQGPSPNSPVYGRYRYSKTSIQYLDRIVIPGYLWITHA
jgi:hypothetical protein